MIFYDASEIMEETFPIYRKPRRPESCSNQAQCSLTRKTRQFLKVNPLLSKCLLCAVVDRVFAVELHSSYFTYP
jgi:hypothetical protein